MNKSIVFFGNERLSSSQSPSRTPILKTLIEQEYSIKAIVLSSKPSTSRKKRPLEVVAIAEANSIPVIYVETMSSLIDTLRELSAEIGVLAAFGRIVPQEVIDLFPYGIVNVHPSRLPEYRGSTPIEQAILSGDSSTTVSIMDLVSEMDAGPVYAQKEVPIPDRATKAELTHLLAETGAQELKDALPLILSGTLKKIEQNHEAATYTSRLSKASGAIDWSKPALQIEREIRAYADWPSSTTVLGDIQCTITKAQVYEGDLILNPGELHMTKDQLIVGCGDNSLLEVRMLKPINKQEMAADAFLRGYGSRL